MKLNKYHDKKRLIKYERIKKMLDKKNKKINLDPIVKPPSEEIKYKRFLKEIDLSKSVAILERKHYKAKSLINVSIF